MFGPVSLAFVQDEEKKIADCFCPTGSPRDLLVVLCSSKIIKEIMKNAILLFVHCVTFNSGAFLQMKEKNIY